MPFALNKMKNQKIPSAEGAAKLSTLEKKFVYFSSNNNLMDVG